MPGMQPNDVYVLPIVEDPRLSPDGTTVAFVAEVADEASNDYRSSVWLVPVDGSSPPRRLTAGTAHDFMPRWSPDGTRIAFVSTRRKTPQLYVIDVRGGEARSLTNVPEGAVEPAWSPDGTRLAFTSVVPDPAYDEKDERRRKPRRITRLHYKADGAGWTCDRFRHVFTVPADGSEEPTQLTFGEFQDSQPVWSPDGSTLLFVSGRSDGAELSMAKDLYLVAPEGGEPRQLTGGDGVYTSPSWSPDGASIAVRYNRELLVGPTNVQIAVVDAATGDTRVLTTALDRNCGPYFEPREPIWTPAGDLLFPVEDAGYTHLYRVPSDGSADPTVVLGGNVVVNGHDAVGDVLVHLETTAARPPELFCGDRRLTDLTDEFTATRELVPAEHFTAASVDGYEVDAWVMRPVGYEPGRRYPVLLNIHGGPFTQYRDGFFDEFQVYAAAGYVVLYSNPRGSSGISEEAARAIRGPVDGGDGMGGADYRDVMAVVDEALRRFDFCDPDRLGVMGGSYGGYMTTWIVAHEDRFRAACAERSVCSWLSFHGMSDAGYFVESYIGAAPHEAPEAYMQISPLTYVDNIQTPLLVLHSENDFRAPVQEAEQLFVALRTLKREVEFVRFPAADHDMSRHGAPHQRVMRFEVLLEWFERYLGDKASARAGKATTRRKKQ